MLAETDIDLWLNIANFQTWSWVLVINHAIISLQAIQQDHLVTILVVIAFANKRRVHRAIIVYKIIS